MKFLKLNNQRVINTAFIASLYVAGRETDARLMLETSYGGSFIVSHHKNFHDAEIALQDLTDTLEGE